jgi:IMP cyclohydrolase
MTNENFSVLEKMAYPGRFIITGSLANEKNVVIYGLSGRSASSQARVLKSRKQNDLLTVFTEPTDPEVLAKGDPALLVYDALITDSETTVVSNGAQTNKLWEAGQLYSKLNDVKKNISEFVNGVLFDLERNNAVTDIFTSPERAIAAYCSSTKLIQELKDGRKIDLACYEPDAPIFTPRISAYIDHLTGNAGFVVIRKDIDSDVHVPTIEKHFFKPIASRGYLIATYDGANPPSPAIIPSFRGIGRPVEFGDLRNPKEIANLVYEAMGEYAVGTACVLPESMSVGIKNLHNVK